jgi:hypothetical protein
MIEQAQPQGLALKPTLVERLVLGKNPARSKYVYSAPNVGGTLHDSMTPGWRILEYVPKRAKWREWPDRREFAGWYLPLAEPRAIPEGALIHQSVLERMDRDQNYRPVNLPSAYATEEMADELSRAEVG